MTAYMCESVNFMSMENKCVPLYASINAIQYFNITVCACRHQLVAVCADKVQCVSVGIQEMSLSCVIVSV